MSALLSKNRDHLVRNVSFIIAGAILLLAGLAMPAHAAIISWNAGDGSWNSAANWSPNVVPFLGDDVRIGNLPGVQNSTVTVTGGADLETLEITDGMTVDLFDTEITTGDDIWILDANSRLIARPHGGGNFYDLQGILHLGAGAYLELRDDVPVRIFTGSESAGTISGRGVIEVWAATPFTNDGVIDPGGNGGIVLSQQVNSPIDLDGTSGNGQLLLNIPFDQLEINASGLSDSFSGSVFMVPGALLTMNIAEGWEIGGDGSINVAGSDNPAAASQIAGSELTLGGMINVGGAQGQLRVLAPAMIMPAAIVNVGEDGDRLEFEGTTTALGGQFTLGNDGQLDFEGETTLQGGVFNTHSALVFDGSVSFNGPTVWDGNVTINGAARQNGVATVAGNTVIDADTLDLDGAFGPTTWNVHSNAIINAASIDTTSGNTYDGTLNVGAGFFGQLTINIDSLAPQWTMAGEMNLNGVAAAAFFLNRVGGSHLRISGDVNVTHRVRITADATFDDDSVTTFVEESAALQMTGQTLIFSGAVFNGPGTLDNGATGELTLESGTTLDQVGLVNRGLLEVGNSPGIAAVDEFENMASGTWLVEIGGHIAGTEHDLLLVTDGAAQLDGTIEVDLIDLIDDIVGPFLPQVGDQFTVLTAVGGVSGTFLNNPVSSIAGQQFHWTVVYNPNDVVLELTQIVPEPTAFAIAAGACLLGSCRMRKSTAAPCAAVGALSLVHQRHNAGKVNGSSAATWVGLISAVVLLSSSSAAWAVDMHWNFAGQGRWSHDDKWSPAGVPGGGDNAFIGSLPGVEDETVFMDQDVTVSNLALTNGMGLQTSIHCCGEEVIGKKLTVNGVTSIGNDARLVVYESGPGIDFTSDTLNILDNFALIQGAEVQFGSELIVAADGQFRGTGLVQFTGNGTTLINDGELAHGPGSITYTQMNGGSFNLDGLSGTGVISIGSAGGMFPDALLSFNGGGLTDAFSGEIRFGSNALLDMSVGPWVADSNSLIDVFFSGGPNRLAGDEVTLAGEVDVTSFADFLIEADAVLASTANVNIGSNAHAAFAAFSSTTVQGGEYTVAEGGRFEFHGETTVLGGEFVLEDGAGLIFNGDTTIRGGVFNSNTEGAAGVHGTRLNGPTEWDGEVSMQGLVHQFGPATVSGTTVISAEVFNLDGAGMTQPPWAINSSLVVNAQAIDDVGGNIIESELNVGAGFFGMLTINLENPEDDWAPYDMTLTGAQLAAFPLDRVGGSPMRIAGELNIVHRVRVNSDTRFAFGGATNFADAASALHMTGKTQVAAGAQFNGAGSLHNSPTGEMSLDDGASLGQVGLVNRGLLEIGDSPGIAAVDRFENMAGGTWLVEIGGHLAGAEHDLLIASGGAAVLNGAIEVDLIDAGGGLFLPKIGDTFTVLMAVGGVSGTFLNDPVSSAPGMQFHWSVLYHPNDVTLVLTNVTVPEPATLGLVVVGAIAIALVRGPRAGSRGIDHMPL